jgi:hypothetical protein
MPTPAASTTTTRRAKSRRARARLRRARPLSKSSSMTLVRSGSMCSGMTISRFARFARASSSESFGATGARGGMRRVRPDCFGVAEAGSFASFRTPMACPWRWRGRTVAQVTRGQAQRVLHRTGGLIGALTESTPSKAAMNGRSSRTRADERQPQRARFTANPRASSTREIPHPNTRWVMDPQREHQITAQYGVWGKSPHPELGNLSPIRLRTSHF